MGILSINVYLITCVVLAPTTDRTHKMCFDILVIMHTVVDFGLSVDQVTPRGDKMLICRLFLVVDLIESSSACILFIFNMQTQFCDVEEIYLLQNRALN